MLKGFLAIGVITKATQFLGDSLAEAREAQKVSAQTGAVLKSTGKIANVSAGQIGKLSTALSKKIGVDDEEIQAGENMLLTFTNVRNEVGKGNDIFTQATRTVQDMAAAFGGDATSNSKILGKALNDPIKGVSALTRVGVSFTDAQKEQIKTLVESGHTLKAQKIILGELSKETKGSAEAQVTASDKARVSLGNLEETIGTALLPVIDRMANFFTTKAAPAITDFVTGMQDGTGAGGQFRDVLVKIGSTVKGVLSFLNGLPGPVKSFGIEAGIAAIVVPRLTSALNGMSTALGGGTSKLAGWRKGLLLTAGVGGIGAIEEGARTGNKAVSLLGDALTGAFVGGTLGSAIPVVGTAVGAVGGAAVGAGIGLFKMHKAADAAGDSSAGASPKIKGLADSLNQTTGAATRATKAMILEKLQQDGIVTSAGQLGIATSDLIKSSLGNKKAIDRVNTAWAKNGNLLDGLTNSNISDWLGTLRQDLSKSQAQIKANNAALDGTDRAAKKAGPALGSVGKDRPATNKWAALYAGDLMKATGDTSAFSKKTQQLLGAATGATNKLSTAIRNIPKHVTITIRTNHIGGVTSSAGGHSADAGRTSAGGLVDGVVGGSKDDIAAAYGIAAKAHADGVEKVSKAIKERIGKLRDSLSSVRDDFAALVEPIASNFTQGLFDFDTASAFTANLTTVKGTLTTLLANFAKLKGEGLSPGFLYQLFQAGGPGLINSLAALDTAGAQSAAALFGDVTSLSNQLGTAVAGSTDKGAALENQTVRLERKLDHLIKAVHDSGDKTKEAVTKPAKNARRRAVMA